MDRNTTVFSASPFATNPRPRHHRRRFFATSRFLSSSRPRTLSVILELRYSDIACRRLLPPFVASSPANYSPSSINALNGNISRLRSTRGPIGMDGFQERVRWRSIMRLMIGRSANGSGTPDFRYLSKSAYWSARGFFARGSRAEIEGDTFGRFHESSCGS